MSESTKLPATTEEKKAGEARQRAQVESQEKEPKRLDALHTEHGDTTIAEGVVQKIAGIAAREVSGVYAMGTAARRVVNSLTNRIPGGTPNVTGGVAVQKGESEAAVDVSVVVEYGVSIVEVSNQIRENVINAVEYGTGLTVVSVDVSVTDVHLPEDETDEDAQQSASSTPALR